MVRRAARSVRVKTEPVRVGAGLEGDGVHEPADGVVDAQVAVDFLADAVGHLGAQDSPRAALVGLQLIQRRLELPALGVESGQLGGGRGVRIGDRGEQPVAILGLRRQASLTA